MTNWTLAQIKAKLFNDLDIQDEDFAVDTEVTGYINEAIKDAEAVIHKLGVEDNYFLSNVPIPLGANDFSLALAVVAPNIYANKIKHFLFNDGTVKYEVLRLKRIPATNVIDPNEDYRYILSNLTPDGGPQINWYPQVSPNRPNNVILRTTGDLASTNQLTNLASVVGIVIGQAVVGLGIPANTLVNNIVGNTVTLSRNATLTATGVSVTFFTTGTPSLMTLWYIREANQLVNSTDVCDIPEFVNYILQHAKKRIYEKEGNPNVVQAIADTKELRNLMIQTLENMVEDERNQIEPDLSFYDDFDSYDLYHY